MNDKEWGVAALVGGCALLVLALSLAASFQREAVQAERLDRACQAGHAATSSPLQDSLFTLASGCR